jgi:hypothetical protein
VPLGELVGEAGGDHPRQEQARAGAAQPQAPRDGTAAPWPLPRRLTERLLEGWGIGHGAAGAIDQAGAMPGPSLFIQGGMLHGTTDTGEEAVKEAQREFGPRLTVCCRGEL